MAVKTGNGERLARRSLGEGGGTGNGLPAEALAKAGEREEALEHYRELLESMGRLGIKLLCYNFMVGKGWSRTGVREGRGGAKATYFSLEETEKNVTSDLGLKTASAEVRSLESEVLLLSHDQVWANYEYFIKAVMPTAEKCGVRMGLHPDDPCLPSLGGYARIFGSVEAYDRAYALYPSPSNAVTFCQANFKLMLGNGDCFSHKKHKEHKGFASSASFAAKNNPENPVNPVQTLAAAARHFGKRIAFIHVRDVEGTKEDFTELFHDQGDTDQFALMRTYRELGLDVPVRGDHVPEMAYDRDLTPEGTPGYFTLGRLFANGYLKALLQQKASRSDA
jgi:mannonate dehydratase